MVLPWMENGGILRYIAKIRAQGTLPDGQLKASIDNWVRYQSHSPLCNVFL